MKTIFADYNATTEAGHLCLTTRGSQDDIQRRDLHAGDWAWLSDSEVIVGARLAIDPRYGLIGVPDWQTIVHLDDEESQDFEKVRTALQELLAQPRPTLDDEWRVFQLLTIFEVLAPPAAASAVRPGYFAFRRAGTLLCLGKPELALLEIEESRRINPGNPNDDRLYLEILRRVDLTRARLEAETLAAKPGISAGVLAECVNVLATHADDLPEDQFPPVARRILEWVDRFQGAPGREGVRAFPHAQLLFNQGVTLLRLGRIAEARRTLDLARATDPVLPEIEEASRLTSYDQRAREIATRVRSRQIAA
jgi:hypothetical protein